MSKVTVVRGRTPREHGGRGEHCACAGGVPIGQSERMVSLVAGTGLTMMAMRSRGILRAGLLLGLAGGMFQRGVTGRCYFGRMISKIDHMVNGKPVMCRTPQKLDDEVSVASEGSFPASDAPSFTPVMGSAESE